MKTPNQFYQFVKNKYIDALGKLGPYLLWVPNWCGQCASLGRQYIVQCFGYNDRSYGDGWQYSNIPKGKRLSKPKDWCLIVWTKQSGLPYGHVAIYYKGQMISQNPSKAILMPIWSGKKYYIQPYQYKSIKVDRRLLDSKDYIVKKYDKTIEFTAKQNVKVRYGAKAIHGVYKTIKKGEKVKATYYFEYRGFRWIALKYNNRYYCAPLFKKNTNIKYFDW